ncbi:hypothetical protein S7A_19839 [Pantoea sp. Sc1]|nr:hypothetical protein S7A_19839 [Pantoea sp. Sc1]
MFVGRRLMLNQNMNVTVASAYFKAVKHVAEILPKVILDKRTGFQRECAEIAYFPKLCRKMDFHKITGNIWLGQKLTEHSVMRCRGIVCLHLP